MGPGGVAAAIQLNDKGIQGANPGQGWFGEVGIESPSKEHPIATRRDGNAPSIHGGSCAAKALGPDRVAAAVQFDDKRISGTQNAEIRRGQAAATRKACTQVNKTAAVHGDVVVTTQGTGASDSG